MYGYARVSTRAQKEDRQLAALTQFGVEEEYIVVEKQSGKDFERPMNKKLLKTMCAHDVLVIKSIDRLGRNYQEILEQWALLTKERNIAIVVLDMPLLDTREGRDLTGTLVSDIVLHLLSYVAQTERDFIRQRQAEGIEAAKARGVRFGRERLPMPEDFEDMAEDWWKATSPPGTPRGGWASPGTRSSAAPGSGPPGPGMSGRICPARHGKNVFCDIV